jgi:hypothetical protein
MLVAMPRLTCVFFDLCARQGEEGYFPGVAIEPFGAPNSLGWKAYHGENESGATACASCLLTCIDDVGGGTIPHEIAKPGSGRRVRKRPLFTALRSDAVLKLQKYSTKLRRLRAGPPGSGLGGLAGASRICLCSLSDSRVVVSGQGRRLMLARAIGLAVSSQVIVWAIALSSTDVSPTNASGDEPGPQSLRVTVFEGSAEARIRSEEFSPKTLGGSRNHVDCSEYGQTKSRNENNNPSREICAEIRPVAQR